MRHVLHVAVVAGGLCGLGAAAPVASGATVFGLTEGNGLVSFDSATPGTIQNSVSVSGLAAGESLLGIDFRPAAPGSLYGVGSAGNIYTLDTGSGAATLVAPLGPAPDPPAFTGLSGTNFGVDFNPVPDRLRVTSDAAENYRINVDTGATIVDGTLAYAVGDANAGATPNVVASAYTNSFAGATATTLYGLDAALDILVTQAPPNDGTLNTVGALGVDFSELAGLDIDANGNVAYAASGSQLYVVDLTTGAATAAGTIGDGSGSSVYGLAISNAVTPPPVIPLPPAALAALPVLAGMAGVHGWRLRRRNAC